MSITANNYLMLNHPSLLLRDVPLMFVTSFKYLGFHINSSFYDDHDIRRQMRSVYFRSNYLIRTFSRCCLQVKTMLFSAYCSSLYCAPLWVSFKCTSIRKLSVAYNNVFRRLLSLPRRCSASAMFVQNHVSSFGELWRSSTYSLRERTSSCDKDILSIVYNTVYFTSKWHRRWETTLYT